MSDDTERIMPGRRDPAVVGRIRKNLVRNDDDTLLAVENLVHLIRTYSTVYDTVTEHLAPYDLSFAQFNLLVVLYNAPEHHLPMSEVGERMSVTRTSITKLVDCLERSGLVRRAQQPGDRRVVLAELTDQGRELLRNVVPDHYENVRQMWMGLNPDERLELTHLLLKLRDSLHTYRDTRFATAKSEGEPETPSS